MYAPILMKGMDKILGQFGMGVRENPIRTYDSKEAIQSKVIPGQVAGFGALSDEAKTEFADKARELGILSLPGHADVAGGPTTRGLGREVLKFATPWRGGGNEGGPKGMQQFNPRTLEDELAKVNSTSGYKDAYTSKINELANLAANLQQQQQFQQFSNPAQPRPQTNITPPAIAPQIPAQNAQPMTRPTPGMLPPAPAGDWTSGLPNNSGLAALVSDALKNGQAQKPMWTNMQPGAVSAMPRLTPEQIAEMAGRGTPYPTTINFARR
jgi:hypothetical protein